MDEVFGKYCKKRPDLKECMLKTYNAAKPCLEESEINAINVTAQILSELGDFACFKDGDRIASKYTKFTSASGKNSGFIYLII